MAITRGGSQFQSPGSIRGVQLDLGDLQGSSGFTIFPGPRPFPPPGGGPTPTPPAPTPPAPTPAPSDPLASLNIPIAQEGLPITSDYHNSLRDAVMAIARHLGISQVSAGAAVSFAPAFLQHLTDQGWSLDYGIAAKAATATSAKGWMPVSLPDGALIQGMVVKGAKTGTITAFDIKLVRLPFAATDVTTGTVLIDVGLKDVAAGSFSVPGQVQLPGSAAGFGTAAAQAALQDLKLVDNSQYKYLITAELATGDATPTVQIATMEIGIQL